MTPIQQAKALDLLKRVLTQRDNYPQLVAEITTFVKDNEAADPKAEWDKYADVLGLNKNWFGRTFQKKTQVFKVVGCNPSRPKNCIQIANQRGNVYICGPEFVARYLGP